MAATLGEAVIEIQADMASLRSDMEQQLGKTAPKAGKSVGGKLLGTLTTTLKRGAQVAGGVAIAGIGTAMVKGFGRLNAIDQAQAKLSGLGHSAEGVERIMDNALASVKGTAFGLGDAATIAAGAVAAGVKPGKDLERTLTLMGDAATIAGTDLADMGSVFNKIAAGGKVTGESLQSLTDRGIPILQLLGDQLGTTADETRKMVSEGKVSFADFQSAIEQGMGGAAQKSGQTFSGALANVQAAMGRLGASALSGVFAQMPDLFGKAIESLDGLAPVAERVGTALGGALGGAAERVANIDWAGLGAAVQPLFDSLVSTFGNLRDIAGTVLPVLSDIGSAVLPVLGTAFGAVVIAVEKVTGALADALGWLEQHETTAKVLAGVFTAVLAPAIAVSVAQSVTAWASSAKASVVSAATQVKSHYAVAAGWARQAAAAVTSGAQSLYVWALYKKDAVVAAAAAARAQLTLMATYVRTTAATVAQRGAMLAAAAAAKVTAAAQWLLNAAMSANPLGLVVIALVAVGAALVLAYKKSETFRAIVQQVWSWIKTATKATFEAVLSVVKRVWDSVGGTIKTVVTVIRTIITTYFTVYMTIIQTTLNAIRAVVRKVWSGIRSVITGAVKAIKGVINGLRSVIGTIRGIFTSAWDAARSAVSSGIERVMGLIRGLPGKIKAVGGTLAAAGRDIGGRVLDGIKNGLTAVGGMVSDVANAVKGAINNMLGLPRTIGKGPLKFTIPAFAKGTPYAPGGLALVGEQGPELVNLPRGSRVYTASQTRSMASTPSAGSGFPSKVILRVGAREFTAYVEEIADGRIDAADSLAWQGA